MTHPSEREVLESVRHAVERADAPLVLAVSGGVDSMAMLHAAAKVARQRIAAVATFDHATGAIATRAVAHVVREAGRLELPVVTGRIGTRPSAANGLEAMWRAERHAFLRETASRLRARVATAHTEDDQIETVLMRVMRGSGARGLAGLAATSEMVRPMIGVRRSIVDAYARESGIGWIEDPSNSSTAYLRNRLRREILPALRRADPTLDEALLRTGRDAAALRSDVERFVDRAIRPRRRERTVLVVATMELAGYDRDSLSMLWNALAGRVGLALDRRGTQRCATFTMKKPRAGRIPLSGGWWLEARRDELVLWKRESTDTALSFLPAEGTLVWGSFRFSVVDTSDGADGWSAAIPLSGAAQVRCWQAGDRLAPAYGHERRRVKRYLSDAGVSGSDRARWPVVILGDEIVWIPGVRRSDAATVRFGGPARHYVCERTHG